MKRFQMASLLKFIQTTPTPPVITTPEPVKVKKGRQRKPKPEPEPQPKSKPKPKSRKQKIPIALREQVWIHRMGRVFEGKCPVTWCQNRITVFDFQSGHNIPESKGGQTTLENLIPLCSRCNLSMGDHYTIDEWCQISQPGKAVEVVAIKPKSWCCFS
jgi:hypothetical protein